MSVDGICVGCILHWKGFTFPDGAQANKYLVVVGAHPDKNCLAVVATSKQHRRGNAPGGNPDGGYYHIPGGGKDWFPLDTWLLLDVPREIDAAEFKKEMDAKNLTIEGYLRHDIGNAICNCMKRCDDVSPHHVSLLGPPAQKRA